MTLDALPSWPDTPTRRAIVEFVDAVTQDTGPRFVPPDERVATIDNDGTLWCEKPMPVELGFILQRYVRPFAASRSIVGMLIRPPYGDHAAHPVSL